MIADIRIRDAKKGVWQRKNKEWRKGRAAKHAMQNNPMKRFIHNRDAVSRYQYAAYKKKLAQQGENDTAYWVYDTADAEDEDTALRRKNTLPKTKKQSRRNGNKPVVVAETTGSPLQESSVPSKISQDSSLGSLNDDPVNSPTLSHESPGLLEKQISVLKQRFPQSSHTPTAKSLHHAIKLSAAKKEEAEKMQREKEEAEKQKEIELKKNKAKRTRDKKMAFKRNKRGQIVMKNMMDRMLEKIKKNNRV